MPKNDESNNNRIDFSRMKAMESRTGLFALIYALVFGLLGIFFYSARTFNFPSFFLTASTFCMIGGASLLIGGLLGFLFGIPRSSQHNYQSSDGETNKNKNTPENTNQGIIYKPNTNLEQISDWLTKILVGVGLIQIGEIQNRLWQFAGNVKLQGINAQPDPIFVLSIMLYFSIDGFLISYLWTRLYLAGALNWAELENLSYHLQNLEKKTDEANKKADFAQSAATFGVGKPGVKRNLEEKIAPTICDEIQPGRFTNDPWKGVFGEKSISNNRQLEAEIKKIVNSSDLFSIVLRVHSVDPKNYPLSGTVRFFLHPTFAVDKPVVPVNDKGIAELKITAWGAFTVGACTDDGKTKLELDLSTLEGAPLDFRNR